MADTEAAPKPTEAADEGIQEGFVLTGIDGLDEMLGRGVPAGHIITILGSFGTGKTTFALQFLMQGLINGEKAVYISLEEDVDSVVANAESFGWDLKRYLKEKKVQLVIQVIKMRRLKHPRSVKPYSITEQGLEVHGDMEVF